MLNNKQPLKPRSIKLILVSLIGAITITTSPALIAQQQLAQTALSTAKTDECETTHVKAEYTIKTTEQNIKHPQGNEQTKSQQVTLWRKHNQVAQQFHHNNISEVWYKSKNDRLQLTRHFEQFSRGIEYQPVDMKSNENSDWHQKKSFLSQSFLDGLTYEGPLNQDKNCMQQVSYSKHNKNETIKLAWLPQLQLISSLVIERNNTKKSWHLEQLSLTDKGINNQFATWNNFKTTDYADIGDSEDDPFLQQMINMGFTDNKNTQHGHQH